MERGAGGGAGERALEQVFKQRVSGDARLNRSSGGAIPGTRARTGRVRGGRAIRGQRERAGQKQATEQHTYIHDDETVSLRSQPDRERMTVCPRVSLSTGRTSARVAA